MAVYWLVPGEGIKEENYTGVEGVKEVEEKPDPGDWEKWIEYDKKKKWEQKNKKQEQPKQEVDRTNWWRFFIVKAEMENWYEGIAEEMIEQVTEGYLGYFDKIGKGNKIITREMLVRAGPKLARCMAEIQLVE
jgi:hypothetical protein